MIYRSEDGRVEASPGEPHRKGQNCRLVLVTAAGAEDPRVRLLLLEAVSTVLDVPPHRVQIVPKKR